MKGIILAGGSGTRLYPITRGVCKQLLPVYDKPMIYYPLSVLMLGGITEILIISTPKDLPRFRGLLGDGRHLGLTISYAAQKSPKGIAEALLIGESFINHKPVCLILGDNIFYGHNMSELITQACGLKKGAMIFGYYVKNPQQYGVIEFDADNNVISITEKPRDPKSNWVVTGLYFFDENAVKIAKSVRPSARGELEITDVNNRYIEKGMMQIKRLGRGYAWLDTGSYNSLIDASIFIKTIEERQGLKVGCIEEIAFRRGLISRDDIVRLAKEIKTDYGTYLMELVHEK
ncbi:MAG TPA: glucose-1-phosphate thymidylyltransferase RfbA [Candidatus Omnitrophota bacterium]|nr:glucose-1-phosphate thymidylyltransferase RfbA [Candidatus Omnitrophota bacterium]HQO58862.1 glucose-1-phosphate thymidylyltransferase RfbA [Candidatus Omnitrophota bacterium]